MQEAEAIPEVGTPGPESNALWNLGPVQPVEQTQSLVYLVYLDHLDHPESGNSQVLKLP